MSRDRRYYSIRLNSRSAGFRRPGFLNSSLDLMLCGASEVSRSTKFRREADPTLEYLIDQIMDQITALEDVPNE